VKGTNFRLNVSSGKPTGRKKVGTNQVLNNIQKQDLRTIGGNLGGLKKTKRTYRTTAEGHFTNNQRNKRGGGEDSEYPAKGMSQYCPRTMPEVPTGGAEKKVNYTDQGPRGSGVRDTAFVDQMEAPWEQRAKVVKEESCSFNRT